MMRLALVFVFVLSTCAAAQDVGDASPDAELREWTDTTGKFQIDAKFIEYADNQVTLQRADGSEIKVPLSRLSGGDRAFVRAELKLRKDAAKATPQRPARPANDPVVGDAPVNDRGLGILPLEKPRVFVHVEGMPAPKPEDCVRARWTDPDKDSNLLVEAEAERLKTAARRHLEIEKKFAYGLTRVETHHMVIHAQLPPEEARQIGLALEAMKVHLQQVTGTMALTPLRPDQDEMIIAAGKDHYLRLLKIIESEHEGNLGDSWHLLPELAGGTIDHTSFFYIQANNPTPPAHMAVSQTAGRSIQTAAQGRSPSWLTTGFSAYCENVVLGKNLVRSVRYENKELNIGPNWALEAKRLAVAGALEPWDKVLRLDLRDYELVHHVQSYTMVAYLLHRDAQKFQDLVDALAGGSASAEAIEKAYGQPVAELQKDWLQWLTRG